MTFVLWRSIWKAKKSVLPVMEMEVCPVQLAREKGGCMSLMQVNRWKQEGGILVQDVTEKEQ
jgi:hypothetical protein